MNEAMAVWLEGGGKRLKAAELRARLAALKEKAAKLEALSNERRSLAFNAVETLRRAQSQRSGGQSGQSQGVWKLSETSRRVLPLRPAVKVKAKPKTLVKALTFLRQVFAKKVHTASKLTYVNKSKVIFELYISSMSLDVGLLRTSANLARPCPACPWQRPVGSPALARSSLTFVKLQVLVVWFGCEGEWTYVYIYITGTDLCSLSQS